MGRYLTTRQARKIRGDVEAELRQKRRRREAGREWAFREQQRIWLIENIKRQNRKAIMAKFRHRRPTSL